MLNVSEHPLETFSSRQFPTESVSDEERNHLNMKVKESQREGPMLAGVKRRCSNISEAETCFNVSWYQRLMCLEIGRSSLQIRNFAPEIKTLSVKQLLLNVSVIIVLFDLVVVCQVCK